MIWYKKQSDDDIIVSTRVRLARNLAEYPFPNAMSAGQADAAKKEIFKAVDAEKSFFGDSMRRLEMKELSPEERRELMEKHLISAELADRKEGCALVNSEKELSVMLMEEDHIRIQVIMGGFSIHQAYDAAQKTDDALEKNLNYAFSEKFGYLTACPTNTGTGLRASVMMHLPALEMTGTVGRVIESASRLGLTVRGLYGEGSKAYGSLYQLSNQVTLGFSEEEIIAKVENIANQIKKHEQDARARIAKDARAEDRFWRSFGTLKYARSLSSGEAKSLLSDYITARAMGIIDEKIKVEPIELMVLTEPGHICRMGTGADMTPEERDKKRAELIRSSM